jgi:hypothetical protein
MVLAMFLLAGCAAPSPNPVVASETHTLSLVVDDPAKGVDRIRGMAASMHGYVDGWSVLFNSFAYLGAKADQASVLIRVPPDRLEESLDRIKGWAVDVTGCSVVLQSVAEEYQELRSSITDLEESERAFLQSIEQSPDLQTALVSFEPLLDVRSDLYAGHKRMISLQGQTEMVFIDVELLPVQVGPIQATGPCLDVPAP